MPVPLLMSAALAIAGEFFPDLVGALRRPGGRALAATVVEAAAAAAGVSPSSDAGQIIARVKESPRATEDLRLELEQIDADKEIYLAEIGDRGSARQAEIARGSDGRMRGNLMIAAVAIGLAFCIYAAIKGMVPGANGPTLDAGVLALITTVAGALLKMLSDAFAYEFGSSRGSKEKTEDLIAIGRTNQVAAARAQSQTAQVVARAVQATTNAVTTGAAAATVAAEAVAAAKPRDFVGQLVRGEI